MIELKKKDDPDYRCAAYTDMSQHWPVVSDVIKGTPVLRKKGKTYLPQWPREHKDGYETRLATAVCFDATGRTKRALVGLIFRKDPKLSEKVPQAIKDHLENADSEGTHWTVFTKDFADKTIELGHGVILVDMPPPLKDGEGENAAGVVTAADTRKAGRRPFWVRYGADQIINWREAVINGKTVLQQVTFEEYSTEPDGRFGEKAVTRQRVFMLDDGVVKWELWRKVKDKDGKEAWADEGNGTVENQVEIPVSVAYGEKEGFLRSRPPLLKLALHNVKHYQQASEYDHALHIAGNPLLCSDDADVDETEEKAVGASIQIRVPEGRNVWYAETSGASLTAQADNLEKKKQEMSVMGISFLAERVQVEQTATEEKINSNERTSDLATIQRSIKDCVERVLSFHARFLGMKPEQGGTIEMADPAELVLTTEQIRLMSDEVTRGQMSLETYWAMKAKAGLQPDDFDPVLERERIGQMQPTI